MSKTISDYTEQDFLALIKEIFKENAAESDDILDELLEEFERVTQHPDGTDLIYYPEEPGDDKPERIIERVKEWRSTQGLPGFKK
ncbi:bacteriocin immunity protein [Marinobacter halodurans]|nr:bacteriocin immunity protein [Marinobacter halodurans]